MVSISNSYRKRYFYICEVCKEAIPQRLDVIKNMDRPICRTCSNKLKGRDNRKKISNTLKEYWNNLSEEEKKLKMMHLRRKDVVDKAHQTLKKLYREGQLRPWNKGVKLPTNTGKTWFKPGTIPWNYKGINDLREMSKEKLYKLWKSNIMRRDFYTCQLCKSKKNLQVHHVNIPMKDIISLILDKHNVKNFNSLDISEKRKLVNELVEFHLNNVEGITLCKECHSYIHKIKVLDMQ